MFCAGKCLCRVFHFSTQKKCISGWSGIRQPYMESAIAPSIGYLHLKNFFFHVGILISSTMVILRILFIMEVLWVIPSHLSRTPRTYKLLQQMKGKRSIFMMILKLITQENMKSSSTKTEASVSMQFQRKTAEKTDMKTYLKMFYSFV